MIWSYSFGYVSISLWLSFTIIGILCAYLRDTSPSAPKVVATALQPPSTARSTMLLGSK